MHKKLLNEAIFHLTISAEGPLLIKSGLETWVPTTPDMEFIRTWDARLREETVFIPGSSLKGTLRSYSEKIARTLNASCCDPFDQNENSPTASCGARLKKLAEESDSAAIYQQSCTACKIYGSTVLAGRAAFTDAYPLQSLERKLTKRTAVAIDRVLGSVAFGPFDFEALVSGAFTTQIRVRNFELWQLGLLGLAVRDLCQGRVRIGYGKSRGFGNVSAKLSKLELRSIADDGLTMNNGQLTVKGMGALLDQAKHEKLDQTDREKYGINPAEIQPVIFPSASVLDNDLIGHGVSFALPEQTEDWCAPEAAVLFSECVRVYWQAYRDAPQKGDWRG